MPVASKSNIHGHVLGKELVVSFNTSGVEEGYVNRYSSL